MARMATTAATIMTFVPITMMAADSDGRRG